MHKIVIMAVTLVAFILSGCSSTRSYRDAKVVAPHATLILEAEAKTFFSRPIYASLYDFNQIKSGEACGQKGLIFKETIIKKSAYLGTISADSKHPSRAFKIPAGPLRVYLDFIDKRGNVTVINYADIIFLAEKNQDYKFSFKRIKTSSGNIVGDYSFQQKTKKGYIDIEKIGKFDMEICENHIKNRKAKGE